MSFLIIRCCCAALLSAAVEDTSASAPKPGPGAAVAAVAVAGAIAVAVAVAAGEVADCAELGFPAMPAAARTFGGVTSAYVSIRQHVREQWVGE
jgi:hypothetical protein